jgi:hypothetical protein
MYFDKYEAELSTEIKEPTTDEYEKEKASQDDAEVTDEPTEITDEPAEDPFDTGEGTIDFDT